MTVNDTDKFLVNRSGSSYHLEAQNLMAELQDDDLMLVNRSGKSYKATGAEIKESLKPPAEVIKPQIIAPADGAGQGVEIETDIITEVSSTTPTTYKYWLSHVVDSKWSEFATAGNGYPQPNEANVGDAGTGTYGKVYHVDCGTPGGKFGLKPGLNNNTDYGEVLIFVSDDGVNYRLQQTVPGGDQNLKDIILTARYGRISRNGDFGPQYWGIWNAGTVDYLGFASAKSLLLFNAGDPVRQNDDAATATYQSYTINNSLNQYRMYISGITGTFVANAGKYVIGPEVLSGDAAVDPSGVNFLGSTFASSDGSLVAGSADWQVTTLADTGYSSIVSEVEKHPDMTDPQPKWTSGALEGETEYRARTKYYAASGEESPWSDDVTFKTKGGGNEGYRSATPGHVYNLKKSGGFAVVGDKISIPGDVKIVAVANGKGPSVNYLAIYLGVDGFAYTTEEYYDVNVTKNTNLGTDLVSVWHAYSAKNDGWATLSADGTLRACPQGTLSNPHNIVPLPTGFKPFRILGGGGVCDVAFVEGFYENGNEEIKALRLKNDLTPARVGSAGVVGNRGAELQDLNIQLPSGEKVKDIAGINGGNYDAPVLAILSESGKIYIAHDQSIGTTYQPSVLGLPNGGTNNNPQLLTADGADTKNFIRVSTFASCYQNFSGFTAVTDTGELWGAWMDKHASTGSGAKKPWHKFADDAADVAYACYGGDLWVYLTKSGELKGAAGNLVINDIDTSAQRDPSIAWTSLGSLPHNQNIQATAATGTKIIIP